MGGTVLHVGALGQASVLKVITNMLAFVHLVAVGEALMLAKRGGIDLRTAFEGIKASSGNSFVHETESQVILNGSYNIGFTMDLASKDLGLAHRLGRELGVPLELAGLVEARWSSCSRMPSAPTFGRPASRRCSRTRPQSPRRLRMTTPRSEDSNGDLDIVGRDLYPIDRLET
jgi:3-hydroxyisobutyrate dehydrogenase-like beta-hydroxyacid dehydrogenase